MARSRSSFGTSAVRSSRCREFLSVEPLSMPDADGGAGDLYIMKLHGRNARQAPTGAIVVRP
jgi:hypothetical protein